MKAKVSTLSLMLSIFLILAIFSIPAYCSSIRSISYTYFNNATLQAFSLDKNYTNGFSAIVYNKLVYNTTTGKAAIVRLHGNSNLTKGAYIELSYWSNGELHIWYNDGTTNTEIGAGYWKSGNATKILVSDKGELTIIDYANKYIVKNYGVADFDLYYVGGHGETTASIVTSGYVTIEVNDPSVNTEVNTTVMAWIPLIITFAMLGIVLSIIKGFGKF